MAKPLLLWERGQTEEKETPLSQSRSHSHFLSHVPFPFSSALIPSLPESLAGYKTKRLMRVQLSTPSLHFSNNSRSLLSYSSLKHHLSLLRPSLWFSLCLSECQRVSHAPTAEGRARCTSVYIETVPLIFRSKSRSL